MGDARIVWDPATASGDFAMVGTALEIGNDLETAVLVSLFTDRVADADDILLPGQASDPRGWWADTYTQDQIGSKLWQVFWRPTSTDTLNWARDTATKALQWMLDDGVAASVTVTPAWVARGALGLQIVIVEPTGKTTPFSYVWGEVGQPTGAPELAPGNVTYIAKAVLGQFDLRKNTLGAP